jgi:2-iminobutanoate/2-iminopropanoate deaminase
MNLPFSEAVRVGNMLYLLGVIGNILGKKQLVSGGIQAETKQTMENLNLTRLLLSRDSCFNDLCLNCSRSYKFSTGVFKVSGTPTATFKQVPKS